jgi:lysophospholipase L1-like esterase
LKLRRRWRRLLVATLALPVTAVAVLAVEIEVARRGENLPDADPFELDGRIGTGAGPALAMTWLGDSTGAGVGATTAETALPRVVAERVSATLDRPVDLRVLALSGARVDDVATDQAGGVDAEADLVVVTVGSNDVTHLTRVATFRTAYRRMLDRLPDGARVVLLGVPDMGAVPRLAQPLRAVTGVRGGTIDAVIADLAGDGGLGYVDIAGETGPAFRRHPDRYFAADRYHPDDDGYRLWADAVVPVVEEQLGGS